MLFHDVHHIAVIASDYEKAADFYIRRLGFAVTRDIIRPERGDRLIGLRVNDTTEIELFIKPDAPVRVTRPEALGLRHLCFAVDDAQETAARLEDMGIACEPVREDEGGRRFTFFFDPDGLPIEIHE